MEWNIFRLIFNWASMLWLYGLWFIRLTVLLCRQLLLNFWFNWTEFFYFPLFFWLLSLLLYS